MLTSPFPLITTDDRASVRDAMQQLGLWAQDEHIERVGRAGEGNMNLVLRVETNRRQVVIKQSRPWVEKYPSIDAPAERILAEIDFYDRVATYEQVRTRMPRLLSSSEDWHLMALEDLGEASDYTDLYGGGRPESMPLEEATSWLARLHSVPVAVSERGLIGNFALRELNHAHIFVIPLQEPSAIPLDSVCPGLEELATEVRRYDGLHEVSARLGAIYLDTGKHLLHGDFYPGSWLRTSDGLRVIDPEFTFAGPREFDLAILSAHCVMTGAADASVDDVCRTYRQSGGGDVDRSLTRKFAAIEIIRRLIGVAQLSLDVGIVERREMARVARRWLAG